MSTISSSILSPIDPDYLQNIHNGRDEITIQRTDYKSIDNSGFLKITGSLIKPIFFKSKKLHTFFFHIY